MLLVVVFFLPINSFALFAAGLHSATFQGGIDLANDLAGAHSVQSADLDRDGDQDIIAAGREAGQVIWFENDGAAFPQFIRHDVGYLSGVYAVFPADVDRDGAIDIVATGVGTVVPSGDPPASTSPSEERKADTSAADGAIVWFQNNLRTGGGFALQSVATALQYAVAIHVADVDHDGDPDLLSAERDGNRIAWYENNGLQPPSFVAHTISTNALAAVSVHSADLDGDGDLDVISASEDDNKIAGYLNDGARPPNFSEIVLYAPGPPPPNSDYAKAVYAADLDGDGDVDIAYVGEDNHEVGWLENSGGAPPTFVPHILANDADHAKAILVVDLDHDGDQDLLAASSDDNKVAWYENGGGAPTVFVAHLITTSAVGARAVAVADLDHDGDQDVLTASRLDNRIVWYPNPTIHRTALFNEGTQHIIQVRLGARGVHAADVDGDGDTDLLSIAERDLYWHENNGASPPVFTNHLIDDQQIDGGRWVAAGDLDQDGDLDVVAASKRINQISWYENLGGSPPAFATHIVTQEAKGARAVLVADVDRDGDLDLYSASDTDDSIAWYENSGGRPPSFARHVISEHADYARSAYAGDLDGDGDIDFMSASQLDNKVAWYENRGGSPLQFFERAPDTGASGVQHIHGDDIDGDGDLDMVTALELDNSIRWYENIGGSPPTFPMHFVSRAAPAVHAVYTGDADQDGDIDIFAAIEGSNTIAWYENNGERTPSFTEHIVAQNTLVAHGIYAADVDGDGDLDIISASRDDGKVAWYENLGGQFAMSATVDRNNSSRLNIVVSHRGRPGDPDLELANVELRLEDESGAPLNNETANELIQRINLYRVDCCGQVGDLANAPLLASVSPLEVAADGRQIINLISGDPNARVPAGGQAVFVVMVEGAPASCQNGQRAYQVVNLVSSRTARNAVDQQPLLAEYMRASDHSFVLDDVDRPSLVINEFMASNTVTLIDPDDPNDYPDWIEIYNTSAAAIDLGGKYLTDDLSFPDRHRIADGVVIPSHGYVVFYADGQPQQGPRHLNFKLEKNGESIGLFEATATGMKKLDEHIFGVQEADVTEGRYPNGGAGWQRLGLPTPGGPNQSFAVTSQTYLPIVTRGVACE